MVNLNFRLHFLVGAASGRDVIFFYCDNVNEPLENIGRLCENGYLN